MIRLRIILFDLQILSLLSFVNVSVKDKHVLQLQAGNRYWRLPKLLDYNSLKTQKYATYSSVRN